MQLVLAPGSVTAQEALPRLEELLNEIDNTEVFVTGAFGIGSRTPVTDFWLVLEDGSEVPVLLDPEARDLPSFTGCFYSPGHGGTPCAMTGYGYLQRKGAVVHLVLTSVESLAAPKELP